MPTETVATTVESSLCAAIHASTAKRGTPFKNVETNAERLCITSHCESRAIRAFELDLAFVIGPVEDDLAPTEIRRDPLHIYAPPGPWQELDEAEWVLDPAGSLIDEGLARLGISPRVTIEGNNPEVLRQLVSLGFGWSVLPPAVAESGEGRKMEYARGVQVTELPLIAARPPRRASEPRADAYTRLVIDLGQSSKIRSTEPRRPRPGTISGHGNAGRLDDARQELVEWYRAFDAQPGLRRGGDLGSSTLSEIDTALASRGTEVACRELHEELEARPWPRFGGRGWDVIRGALAERLGMPVEAERHYVAGRDWAAREGLPVEEGRCLLGLAR